MGLEIASRCHPEDGNAQPESHPSGVGTGLSLQPVDLGEDRFPLGTLGYVPDPSVRRLDDATLVGNDKGEGLAKPETFAVSLL